MPDDDYLLYLKGRNWARWLVIIASVWQILLLIRIAQICPVSRPTAFLLIAYATLALFLLIDLNRAYLVQPAPTYK